MKTVGIFTFFQTNYGAILQAYSLQKYLSEQPGVEAEIIDFTTPDHLKGHRVFQKQKNGTITSRLAYYLLTLIRYKQLKRRVIRTDAFKKQYLVFSRRFNSVEDVLSNHPEKDIYLTGSDQVFNPNGRYLPVYYLSFDKGAGKKVAYAPSFGISTFTKQTADVISRYLCDFDYLSCRESSGASFLSQITRREVPVVLDPVFLHSSDEWMKVSSRPSYSGNYIFVYDLNGGEALISLANTIKEKTQLPVVCLTRNRLRFYRVDLQCYDAGPAEFLGWIQHASFVVTDSFHGTAFSLILNRDFFTYVALEKTSTRLKEVLGKVGLDERLIFKGQLQSFDFMAYPSISRIDLAALSSDSKAYIQSFLQ